MLNVWWSMRRERDFNPRTPGFNTDHSATLSPLHPQLVFSHVHYFFYSYPSDPNFLFAVNK